MFDGNKYVTLVTIVLVIIFFAFVLLNIFLFFFPSGSRHIYTNEERIQEYVYSRKTYSTVLVGSGLIGHFSNPHCKRQNSFSLHLPYNGSCSGVEIIALSKKIPQTLFIETNYIFKGFDGRLRDNLFRQGIYQLRFFVPLLLRKHRFTALLKRLIKSFKTFKIGKKNDFENSDYSIETFIKLYNQVPDAAKFSEDLEKLRQHLYHISSRGCKIIFFEMPLEDRLIHSPLAEVQRTSLKDFFKDFQCLWIEPNPLEAFHFKDGIHLLEESAEQYFSYLNSRAKAMLGRAW